MGRVGWGGRVGEREVGEGGWGGRVGREGWRGRDREGRREKR